MQLLATQPAWLIGAGSSIGISIYTSATLRRGKTQNNAEISEILFCCSLLVDHVMWGSAVKSSW